MNPREYATWTHSLTPDTVGDFILLNFTGKAEWYEIVSIIFEEGLVSVHVQVTDDFDAMRSYEEPSLIHLMRSPEKDDD